MSVPVYLHVSGISRKNNIIVSVKIIFAFALRDIRKEDEYHAGFEPGTS
jgi:hypothetical protein